jgi:hypothetical protein
MGMQLKTERLVRDAESVAATGRRLAGRVGTRGSEDHVRATLARAVREREREAATSGARAGNCPSRHGEPKPEPIGQRQATASMIDAVVDYAMSRVVASTADSTTGGCRQSVLLAVPFPHAEAHAGGVRGSVILEGAGRPPRPFRLSGVPLQRISGTASWTIAGTAGSAAASASHRKHASVLDAVCDDFTDAELLELIETFE